MSHFIHFLGGCYFLKNCCAKPQTPSAIAHCHRHRLVSYLRCSLWLFLSQRENSKKQKTKVPLSKRIAHGLVNGFPFLKIGPEVLHKDSFLRPVPRPKGEVCLPMQVAKFPSSCLTRKKVAGAWAHSSLHHDALLCGVTVSWLPNPGAIWIIHPENPHASKKVP